MGLSGPSTTMLSLVVESEPDPRDLALLEARLADAATAAVGLRAEREFGIFVRDDAGAVVAGASGATWGGCCQVHVLWVDDSLRGRGLARALMAEAEAEARRQGCRLVMGLTYDALTADFYDRLGYRSDRRLPGGHDDPLVSQGPMSRGDDR